MSRVKVSVPGLILLLAILALTSCAEPSTPTSTATVTLTPNTTTSTPTIQATATPLEPSSLTRSKKIIKVRAEETVLRYQDESFWGEDEFSTILRNKGEFSSKLVDKFIEDVSERGERNEQAVNASVEFNESKRSTTLRCDIYNAISKSGDSYHATFFWLLRPLELDFLDDHFGESEEGLFWEGIVCGIPTTITIELPVIDDLVYKAWASPVGHCHAHAWWGLPP